MNTSGREGQRQGGVALASGDKINFTRESRGGLVGWTQLAFHGHTALSDRRTPLLMQSWHLGVVSVTVSRGS